MENTIITIVSGSFAAINVVWATIAIFSRPVLGDVCDEHLLWARRYAYIAAICSIIFLASLYT
jgi:hypothetical protein